MKSMLRKFADDEFGNVLIDWGVLLTGTIMMATAVIFTFASSPDSLTEDTGTRAVTVETEMAQS